MGVPLFSVAGTPEKWTQADGSLGIPALQLITAKVPLFKFSQPSTSLQNWKYIHLIVISVQT